MKNIILFLIFVNFTSLLTAQVYEAGLTVGGTNYVGDIGRNYYLYPNKLAGALFFKYNYNPRVALKATYSYLPIHGDDFNADTGFRKYRLNTNGETYNFSNFINELAVGIEYNFYEYDLSDKEKNWTPYLLLELAAFNYKSVTSYDAAGNNTEFGRKTSLAIPFGLGYKSKLYGNLAFAIEAKFRYTFEDDLDYLSIKNKTGNLDGTGNDWYMFTGVSLIYTFGRPACYTNGL